MINLGDEEIETQTRLVYRFCNSLSFRQWQVEDWTLPEKLARSRDYANAGNCVGQDKLRKYYLVKATCVGSNATGEEGAPTKATPKSKSINGRAVLSSVVFTDPTALPGRTAHPDRVRDLSRLNHVVSSAITEADSRISPKNA